MRIRRAFLVAAYLITVIGFFESTARIALSWDPFFRRITGDDDASWRLRWVRRQRGPNRIYYSFDVYHPQRGWALRPGVQGMDLSRGKLLNSNSRGLRGRREYEYRKPPGVIRILAFGDSFTFGEDVDDTETWSSRLEQMVPGSEVLNFGVHGYGHDQMLLYLKEEGIKYQADVVILGYLADDMERNLLCFRDYAKPRYVLDGDRLVVTHTPVPEPEQTLAREVWRSRFFDLLNMSWARLRTRTGAREAEKTRLTLAILDEIASTIRGMGAQPAFAYLPAWGEVTKSGMAMTARERFLFSYCRRRGIQSMYLQRFFLERQRAGVELRAFGHWGPVEHQAAAEGIKAYLLEKGLVRFPDGALGDEIMRRWRASP